MISSAVEASQQRKDYVIPETMKAWALGDPEQLSLADKPGPAEVLVAVKLGPTVDEFAVGDRVEDTIKVVVQNQ